MICGSRWSVRILLAAFGALLLTAAAPAAPPARAPNDDYEFDDLPAYDLHDDDLDYPRRKRYYGEPYYPPLVGLVPGYRYLPDTRPIVRYPTNIYDLFDDAVRHPLVYEFRYGDALDTGPRGESLDRYGPSYYDMYDAYDYPEVTWRPGRLYYFGGYDDPAEILPGTRAIDRSR